MEVVRTDFHRWPVKLRPGQRVRRTSSTGLTRSYIYPFTSFSPFIVSRRTSGGKKRAQTEEQLDVYSVHLLSLWSRWGLSLGRPSAKQVNEKDSLKILARPIRELLLMAENTENENVLSVVQFGQREEQTDRVKKTLSSNESERQRVK